jgi:hypothetical protein
MSVTLELIANSPVYSLYLVEGGGDSVTLVLQESTDPPPTLTLRANVGIPEAPINGVTHGRKDAEWVPVSSDVPTKESITGLKLTDSPQFANTQITNLTTDAISGGVIPATIWTWLGSTAKSVISVLTNLISKVYYLYPQTSLTYTGTIDLTKVDSHYLDWTQSGVHAIQIAANPIVGGSAEILAITDGNALTVSGATQYGDTAIDYTAGKENLFIFHYFNHGIFYTVKQLN